MPSIIWVVLHQDGPAVGTMHPFTGNIGHKPGATPTLAFGPLPPRVSLRRPRTREESLHTRQLPTTHLFLQEVQECLTGADNVDVDLCRYPPTPAVLPARFSASLALRGFSLHSNACPRMPNPTKRRTARHPLPPRASLACFHGFLVVVLCHLAHPGAPCFAFVVVWW